MSEKREDRRIRHTKRAIKNAFLELMDEKPVDKISVTELCERADINRSSFYAHYVDYSAFIDELECDIVRKQIDAFSVLYSTPNYPVTIIEDIVKLIRTNKEMKLILMDYGKHRGALLEEYLHERVLPVWLQSGDISSAHAELLFAYVVRGGYAVLKQWYDSRFELPEKEVCRLLTTVITHGLYSFVHIKL
jgi:AcrR family transcriptional regulator